MRVHILHLPHADAPHDLARLLDGQVEVRWGDPIPAEEDFEVLVAGRPSLAQMQQSRSLQTLVIPFAGIPAETRELVLTHFPGLAVYNLHHNAVATAEMALGLLLAVAKNLLPADRAFRSHDWRIRYLPNQNLLLHGSRCLIMGYGAIGRRLARMCRGLGVEVDVIRRGEGPIELAGGIQVHPLTKLDSLLPQADVLFLALPLTSQTEGLIDANRIALLPAHCIVVNVARGAVIDEKALYDALKAKVIAGAGIDVWYQYPDDVESRVQTPPSAYPFHELENIVMSPHRGGGSRQNEVLRLQHLAELLNLLARGETPATRVNMDAGY